MFVILILSDSSVSGESATKFLNRVSNEILREVLVKRPSGTNRRINVGKLREEFVLNRKEDAANFEDALRYFDSVASFVSTAPLLPGSRPTGPLYDAALRRFQGVLKREGCIEGFESTTPALIDANFCLSVSDLLEEQVSAWAPVSAVKESPPPPIKPKRSLLTVLTSIFRQPESVAVVPPPAILPIAGLDACKTPTRALNLLSNRLKRILLYGAEEDITVFGDALGQGRSAFGWDYALATCSLTHAVERPLFRRLFSLVSIVSTPSPHDVHLNAETRWRDAAALDFYDALVALMRDGLKCDYSRLKPSYLDSFQKLLESLVVAVLSIAPL